MQRRRAIINIKAFTLIELLVAMTIISLLVATLLPTVAAVQAEMRNNLCKALLFREHQNMVDDLEPLVYPCPTSEKAHARTIVLPSTKVSPRHILHCDAAGGSDSPYIWPHMGPQIAGQGVHNGRWNAVRFDGTIESRVGDIRWMGFGVWPEPGLQDKDVW